VQRACNPRVTCVPNSISEGFAREPPPPIPPYPPMGFHPFGGLDTPFGAYPLLAIFFQQIKED